MARVEIIPVGNLGNQMLQLLLLESIKRRVPSLAIGGVKFSEWALERALEQPLEGSRLRLKGQYLDIPLLTGLLSKGWIDALEFAALGFQVAHYLPAAECARLFPRQSLNLPVLAENALLINVRGAEILQNTHKDYGPVPLAFYRQVINETGLQPVFMGQIGEDASSALLREAFPHASFIPSRGVIEDFELIRSAKHVVACVSSFSWLASWLSNAQTIHLPVYGLFNPLQRPDVDLLPTGDARYRFYRFPIRRWTASVDQFADLSKDAVFPEFKLAELVRLRQQAARRLLPRRAWYRAKLLRAVLAHRYLGRGAWVGY